MDWPVIIERNAERLLAVLAPLFVLLASGTRTMLPRPVCRALLMLLRPAESAARRLIIMAARGLVVKQRVARAFPVGITMKSDPERVAPFCMIDPLKRFASEGFERDAGKVQILPRISVPGFINPAFAAETPATENDLVSPAAIHRRLLALRHALDNLPREARRLVRWRTRQTPKKTGRLSPFRPGFAPGYQRHGPREIDAILSDCHYFAQEAWYKTNTS